MEAASAPPQTRDELIRQIREEGEKSEQTAIVIDYIEELWETIDLLRERFGQARAQQIIQALSSLTQEYEDDDD